MTSQKQAREQQYLLQPKGPIGSSRPPTQHQINESVITNQPNEKGMLFKAEATFALMPRFMLSYLFYHR